MSCSTLVYNASVWKWNNNVEYDLNNDVLGEALSGYCIVIKNGFITYVGSTVPSEEFDIRIDAKSSLVLPGLIDSHIHVCSFAESQYFVDLSECYSIQQLVEKVKFHVEKYPDLPWITGVNWDQTKLGRFPTRHDLANIDTTKPIFLYRACWHIGVANNAALTCAHILGAEPGKTAQSPAGGVIEQDEHGSPTGIIKERAVELIYSAQQNLNQVQDTSNPAATSALEQKMRFLKEGVDICARLGLTTVQTNDEGALRGYRSLQEQNQLPLRVFLTPIHDELKRSADTQNGIQGIAPFRPDCVLVDSIPTSNSKPTEALNGWDRNSRLLMERVKIFSDGSLGADTAALRVYSADSNETTLNINGSKGVFVYERSILSEMLVEAYEQGYRVEIHAIGDAAAERVLSALDDSENLLQQRSIHPIKVCDQNESMRELRHWRPILTHCQVLGADLVERMASKGIVANVQPSFVPTDMQWVRDRLTGPQLEYSYVWKTLLQYSSKKKTTTSEEAHSVLSIAGGSDAPIETPNPFTGMYDAIVRSNKHRIKSTQETSTTTTTVAASEVSVFKPEECLSFSQALWAYTVGGAYAAGVEHRLGQIAPGFLGDLVLVDPAVLVDSEKLFALVPDMVLVGGLLSVVNTTSRSGSTPVLEKCSQPLSYLQPEAGMLPSDTLSEAVYHPGRGGYPSAVVDILQEEEMYCVPVQKNRRNMHSSAGFNLPMGLKCACILSGKFCSAN